MWVRTFLLEVSCGEIGRVRIVNSERNIRLLTITNAVFGKGSKELSVSKRDDGHHRCRMTNTNSQGLKADQSDKEALKNRF